jgi:hypothetical protein
MAAQLTWAVLAPWSKRPGSPADYVPKFDQADRLGPQDEGEMIEQLKAWAGVL